MSAERLIDELTALADPRYGLARGFDDAQDTLNAAIREVQELRHLRDDVLPDLRQELDNANAALEAHRPEMQAIRSALRSLARTVAAFASQGRDQALSATDVLVGHLGGDDDPDSVQHIIDWIVGE